MDRVAVRVCRRGDTYRYADRAGQVVCIGLNCGANDLDGTIGKERIAHAALADSPAGQARERMASFIRDARRIPVERDALYNEIKVYDH